MKINRLFIKGFGRLSDLQIDFDPHINIIYGENEKGKSTLHRFIENMLYHPYKTGYKKRQLSEALKKYKPWGKASFSGTMTISDNDIRRIEKDFSTKHPKVSIYDAAGSDVSALYQIDDIYREPQFGQQHVGLSKLMFKNTVSIGQIGKSADQEVATEIKKYVGNIKKTKDATISVQAVQEKIKAERERIGRKTKKQSRYGKRELRLKELDEMRKQAIAIETEITQLQSLGQYLADEIYQAEQQLEQLNRHLQTIENIENNQLKQKADSIVAQIEEQRKAIEELQQYAAFNYDCVSQLKRLKADIESAQRSKQNAQREVESIRKLYGQFNHQKAQSSELEKRKQASVEIDHARQHLADLETARLAIESEIGLLKRQRDMQLPFSATPKYFLPIALLAALFIAGGLAQFNYYIAIGAFLLMALFVVFYWQDKRKRAQLASAAKNEINYAIKQLQSDLENNSANIAAIFEAQHVTDASQLASKLEAIKADLLYAKLAEQKQNEQTERKAEYGKQLVVAERQLTAHEKNLAKLESTKADCFSKLAIESFAQLDDYYQRYCQLEEIKKQVDHQEQLLQEVLAGRQYNSLQIQPIDDDITISDRQHYLTERQTVNDVLIEKRKEFQQLEQQITALEQRGKTKQAIEEEIDALIKQRETDDERLKVLDIVAAKIELSIDKLQKTVMPEVNRTIRQIVSTATAGKYDDIKVNAELDVFVVDKTHGITVPIEQLSSGTIDLMYIGLRIGMADLLTENKCIPLFFDDSFVQIDNGRLRHLLAYLAGLQRQIFIFTCHQRERQLLDELGEAYHQIDL